MGFDGTVGHEKQKNLLLSFLQGDRLPHAFLFSGQDGIGKKKIAREFAQYIFCEQKSGCGICRACKKVLRNSHPDLRIIEQEDSIKIEQSRSISKEIYEYPFESNKRVIIIDQADTMTHEATNALLKTLEEPPPFNLFILITALEREIPLTIKSRCTKISFGPIVVDDLKQFFLKSYKLDEGEAELFSHISCGSIGCGVFWLEGDNLLLRRKLAEFILGKDKSFITATVLSEKISENHISLLRYLNFLLSFLRDIFLIGHKHDASMVVNKDIKELFEWQTVDMSWIMNSIKMIRETIHNMRYNVNRWVLVEDLLLSLMR